MSVILEEKTIKIQWLVPGKNKRNVFGQSGNHWLVKCMNGGQSGSHCLSYRPYREMRKNMLESGWLFFVIENSRYYLRSHRY